jgi:hypothetical protein
MSKDVKYYVGGFFQGTYRTLQEYPVASNEQVPHDDKHLLRIVRGVINNAKQINQQAFNQSTSDAQLKRVNNIQINKSPDWPEQNDRIFSCQTLKLQNVKFSNVHVINSQTYGDITGLVVASVTEGSYEEIEEGNSIENNEKEQRPFWDRWNSGEINEENKINTENIQNSEIDNGGKKWSNFWDRFSGWWLNSGCLGRLLKWLLILLLLWWVLTFTRFGQNIFCGMMKWYYNYQTSEIQKEDKRLMDIIEETKPIRSQCGSQVDFDGDNLERSYTYTLGSISGEVLIEYDMYDVPDRMEIMFNGKLVAETNEEFLAPEYKNLEGKGFASNKGGLRFNYIFKPNELHELTIRMVPNQEVPTTKWQFKVTCP